MKEFGSEMALAARSHALQAGRPLLFDMVLTRASLVFTGTASVMFAYHLWQAAHGSSIWRWAAGAVFWCIFLFLIYGNFSYQLTRLGHLKRLAKFDPQAPAGPELPCDSSTRSLALIIPSYREEVAVVRQTLLSAALQAYPQRRVVLLIDDPDPRGDPAASAELEAMRALVEDLNRSLRAASLPFVSAAKAFHSQTRSGAQALLGDCAQLARLFDRAADWLEARALEMESDNHTDAFFVRSILLTPAMEYRLRAREWAQMAEGTGAGLEPGRIGREYDHLAALFQADISSFERKRYANLSHEPNKAMNLNSYIALLGKAVREVRHEDGLHLENVAPELAGRVIPDADYLITLDADSLLLPGYATRLIGIMEQPGNERIAVAQTPYSAVPNAKTQLERIAGATTDVQYLIHQGFTHHKATFWVGANAVLRHAALLDIAEDDVERGYPIRRFIQDRTVIEDTESTIDLIEKGWSLYNYPERLAYSATPPDFGALTIQRARWANGGLIILPKLVRYMFSGPGRLHRLREGFFRAHYLTSIACVNFGLLILLMLRFPRDFQSIWLPLTALPYYGLYIRDLHQLGYRGKSDILKVYALNLLLLPVNLGGVLRSIHQALLRHKIPFHRTPKVEGRTVVPARYVVALFVISGFCLAAGLFDEATGRWTYGIFALINAAVFFYGINIFIGFRNAWNDILAGSPLQPRLSM